MPSSIRRSFTHQPLGFWLAAWSRHNLPKKLQWPKQFGQFGPLLKLNRSKHIPKWNKLWILAVNNQSSPCCNKLEECLYNNFPWHLTILRTSKMSCQASTSLSSPGTALAAAFACGALGAALGTIEAPGATDFLGPATGTMGVHRKMEGQRVVLLNSKLRFFPHLW